MLQSLIVDGVLGGVGAFIIFLPQILVLFFFISLLEETGYMARAAFHGQTISMVWVKWKKFCATFIELCLCHSVF